MENATSIDTGKLWEAFLDGNATAYGKIFTFYYDDLYGYGLTFCHQHELVKDCIQNVFVEIGQRRKSLAHVESVKAYLIVCLRHMLLKKLEKQRRHNKLKDEQELQDSFQFSPEDIIIHDEISHEKQQALKQAIQSLPARQKEVLFLRYFSGMSYKEIEEILSINYQSVRNCVYRATKQLRNFMSRNNIPQNTVQPIANTFKINSGEL